MHDVTGIAATAGSLAISMAMGAVWWQATRRSAARPARSGGGLGYDMGGDDEMANSDDEAGGESVPLGFTVRAPVFPEDNFGETHRTIIIHDMRRDGDIVRFSHSTWPTYDGAPARVDLTLDWSERLLKDIASAFGLDISPRPGETIFYTNYERRHGTFALKFSEDLSRRWAMAMAMRSDMGDLTRSFARI